MTRGFALTVHCPRCGTAKATGVEVTPIVTCAKCGLGFDPKPREPQPKALVVDVPASLVQQQISDSDAYLVVRDSTMAAITLLLFALAVGGFAYYVLVARHYDYLPFLVVLAFLTGYLGVSRLVGRTIVYVNREVISASHHPLPRRAEHFIGGDVETLEIVPVDAVTGRAYALVAKQRAGEGRAGEHRAIRLATIDSADAINELVAAIREQRARLGAPIADET